MIHVCELGSGIYSAGLTLEQVWWETRFRMAAQPPRSGFLAGISFARASVAPDCGKLQLHPEGTFQVLTAFNNY